MKKIVYLFFIMAMISLNIMASDFVVYTERFNTVEVNVITSLKLVKSDLYGIIMPRIEDKKYLDLRVEGDTLRVLYKKDYYKDMMTSPVRITLLIPDTVKIVTTRDYSKTKKNI